ncbi:hypothetical protein ACFL2V_17145 [Pseudomonadota bacterium]
MKSNIEILRSNWVGILFITVVTTVAAAVYGLNQLDLKYDTTVFLSLGHTQNKVTEESPYEAVRAADHFTETVQGWFKNPAFLGRISEDSGVSADLFGRNQEKQNLIVSYKTVDEASAESIASAIEIVLSQEIVSYNEATNSQFTLALFGSNTTESANKTIFYIILGLFGGFFLGVALSFAYESLFTSSARRNPLRRLLR